MARLLLTLALLLAALPTAARELKIGVSQYPTTLNPLTDPSVALSVLDGMTRRPVTLYDPDWTLVCGLCVTLPTLENGLAKREALPDGKEGMAITYQLQPGATWSDGVPVTADDLVFTWEVGRHPLSGVVSGEAFRRILSIEVIDPKTVVLHVDRVTFDYSSFGSELLPAHVEKPIFEADPANWRNRTAFDADPTNPGLYFGPYRITQVTPGSEVVLERNPTWYGKQPVFDRIRVITVSSTSTLEANLLSGAIDMIAGELGLQIDQALAFEKRHGGDYQVIFKAGLFYEHMDVNLTQGAVADRGVRQALLFAIDRQALSDKLFGGKQPVATSPISPLDPNLTSDLPAYPYDPAQAKALLDAAGWVPGGDGIRVKDGQRLTVSIMTTAGDKTRELVEQVLQAQWKAVGIEARIDNQPARTLFGATLRERKYGDLALFGWIAAPESTNRTLLHSDEIPTAENGWSGQNFTGYDNPDMDGVIDAIERELDPEKRKPLWAELQRIYMTDLPALPLYWRANSYVLPKWLHGLTPTGHLGPTTLWIEDWTVDN